MKRTYAAIAESIGVRLCPDEVGYFVEGCQHSLAGHERGGTRFPGGTVHWTERRITSGGVYRFLLLAALALDANLVGMKPEWKRLYLRQMAVQRLARQARIKVVVPIEERRRVKALLAGVPVTEPLRGKAFQWARR